MKTFISTIVIILVFLFLLLYFVIWGVCMFWSKKLMALFFKRIFY